MRRKGSEISYKSKKEAESVSDKLGEFMKNLRNAQEKKEKKDQDQEQEPAAKL